MGLMRDHISGGRLPEPAGDVRDKAASGGGWYAFLARSGLVAKAFSYGIVGVLAIEVALGSGGKTTSRSGALHTLAQDTLGRVLLVLLALGFAAYALWRFAEAFAEQDGGGETGSAKKWGKRIGLVARGLIYGSLAATAFKILLGAGGGKSQNAQAHSTAATVLSWPGGTWIVGVAGVVIIGAGLWNAYRGLSRTFEDDWRTGRMSKTSRTWGGRVGMVGHLARGVVFALIGIFMIKAAVDYKPKAAIGLDGALQKLAHAAYGPYLLGLTAAGLICYGLYCLADARYRDLSNGGGRSERGSRPRSTHIPAPAGPTRGS
jgi:Domain of Unknown Function (DUF1206)